MYLIVRFAVMNEIYERGAAVRDFVWVQVGFIAVAFLVC